MKRLTVCLKSVPKTAENKIYNTLAYKVKSQSEVQNILNSHGDNVKKSYLSNIN